MSLAFVPSMSISEGERVNEKELAAVLCYCGIVSRGIYVSNMKGIINIYKPNRPMFTVQEGTDITDS